MASAVILGVGGGASLLSPNHLFVFVGRRIVQDSEQVVGIDARGDRTAQASVVLSSDVHSVILGEEGPG